MPVMDSCDLGHITTGLRLMNISRLCQTPQPMCLCLIRHAVGQVTGIFNKLSLKPPSHQTSSHYVLENVAKTGSNGVRTE